MDCDLQVIISPPDIRPLWHSLASEEGRKYEVKSSGICPDEVSTELKMVQSCSSRSVYHGSFDHSFNFCSLLECCGDLSSTMPWQTYSKLYTSAIDCAGRQRMDEYSNHFQFVDWWMDAQLQLISCLGCGIDHPWGDHFSDTTDISFNGDFQGPN